MHLKPIKYIIKVEKEYKDIPVEKELDINNIRSIIIDQDQIIITWDVHEMGHHFLKWSAQYIYRKDMYAPGWRDLITELTRRFEVEDLR